jgi:acetoin utilization deacetylase AcuC-like enzyme
MPAGLVFDKVFTRHDTGDGHPESPERLRAIGRHLEEAGLADRLVKLPLRDATLDELARVHTREYLALAEGEIRSGRRDLSTGDTEVCAESWMVALRAAGSVLNAIDAVFRGEVANAFAAVRPPGHHATADRGMGFCVLNNVAAAARHAQAVHGAKRVAVIDWDVHHGNGTQDIFYQDGSVFYFSTHQWPLYPGTGRAEETGEGDGAGTNLNVPLPAGSGMAEIGAAFREKFLPAADRFRPDLVLVSAGFDSRAGDPLGRFTLTDADFAELTRLLLSLAERHAGGRLVSVLEGGYNTEGLGRAVAAHVRVLLEQARASDA